MNKFTKISAATLFALFLTACDKPAEKPAVESQPTTSQTTETSEKAEAPKAEEMKVEQVAADSQGAEDFKKFIEWKQAQEVIFEQAQSELQQGIETQDPNKAEEALNAFKLKIEGVLKNLDSLELKNEDVKAFKELAKESLVLSNDLISESVKAMTTQTPELQAAVQEKAQKLMQLGAELQQKQIELQNKFAQ